jgi:hypothetical protein
MTGQLGLIGESIHHSRVEPALQQREQLCPHAIARDADIRIRFVLDVCDTAVVEVLGEIGSTARKERTDDVPMSRMHRGEPSGAGPAEQPQQNSLSLVVARVADSDPIGAEVHARAAEELVAGVAGRAFNRS